MSFLVAVATGPGAVASLDEVLASRRSSGEIKWAAHRGRAVAWSAGHQWVSSFDDGDVLVVLDGQLHTACESGLPPAALLHRRYSDQGANFARGLLGDFVAVVLDRKRSRLIVCRDPLGVRPWYQATQGFHHAGATEVATLCSLDWVDDGVDDAEAVAFLAGVAQSRGLTLHRGISTLAPGSTWCSDERSARTWRHHHWNIHPEPDVGWADGIERCRALIGEAVRCRVRAAGAATSDLSGGLDSSAVVGTVVREGLGDDLIVGRLLFDGPEADERRYSDAVIDHWGLRALSMRPWLPSAEETALLSATLQRPPPPPNFTMSRSLHQAFLNEGRSSGLTGIGGDHAFADISYESRVISALQQGQLAILARSVRQGLRAPTAGWRNQLRPLLRDLAGRTGGRLPGHISKVAADALGVTSRIKESHHRLTGVRAIDERADEILSGYVTYVLEEGAVVNDLTGWRTTHPFFDPKVIEGLYGLNPWFPVQGRRDRALQVAAFADRLPVEVTRRVSKVHFSDAVWSVALADPEAVRQLTRGPLQERGWLDAEGFEELLTQVAAKRPGAALPVWRAVALDSWLRQRPN